MRSLFAIVLLGVVTSTATLYAEVDVTQPSRVDSVDAKRTQRESATAGVLLLGVILFIGIMTVVLMMLYGSRLRRLARQRGQCTQQTDDFWFLRPKTGLPSKHTEGEEADQLTDSSR